MSNDENVNVKERKVTISQEPNDDYDVLLDVDIGTDSEHTGNNSSSANKGRSPTNTNQRVQNRGIDLQNDENSSSAILRNSSSAGPTKRAAQRTNKPSKEKLEEVRPLIESNYELVNAIIQNQRAILSVTDNEQTRQALSHLESASELLKKLSTNQ